MNLIKMIHKNHNSDVLPLEVLTEVLKNKSLDARKAVIKRACQKGDLVRIKNGLYVIGESERKFGINNFTVANLISIPSYISLESALSYYNLIPEVVYTTTSITANLSCEFKTPIGQFSYSHLKENYFNHGFYQESSGSNKFLIATPLKSLIDTLIIKKKRYKNIEEIIEDLRFD